MVNAHPLWGNQAVTIELVGKRVYKKECATCHGQAGEGSPDGIIPPLTGQHTIYIKRQLENFRKAERIHDAPEDAEIFKQFGDSEINDILAFLSIQDDWEIKAILWCIKLIRFT